MATILLMVLALCAGVLVDALPYTMEQYERSLVPNLYVGWTKLNGSDFRFTVTMNSSSPGWIALGTSKGLGVGSSLMTTSAAAVIAQTVPNVGFVPFEFELQSTSLEGINLWGANSPSEQAITQCIQRSCTQDAARCQAKPVCVESLQCAATRFTGNGTSAIVTCLDALGSGDTAESRDTLGAFLDTAGCYFSSCAKALQTSVQRTTNIHSVSASQVLVNATQMWTTKMTFTANTIGYVPLDAPYVTLIAAYGSSPQVGDHAGNRASLSLNLNTNVATKGPAPSWVLGHVALMTLGLGILIPLGILLKIAKRRGHASVQVVGVFVGLLGVGWGGFYVEDIGSEAHHVLGIIVMLLFIVQPTTYFLRPSDSSPLLLQHKSDTKKARKEQLEHSTTLTAQTSPEMVLDDRVDAKNKELVRWGRAHGAMGFFILLLAVINSFLGAQLISKSEIDSSSFNGLPIVFVVLACFAFAASVMKRIYFARFPSNNGATRGSEGHITATSSNPNFDNPHVKAEDMLYHNEEDAAAAMPIVPCCLVFKDVCYRAAPNKKDKQGKLILSNCAGFCVPGSLTAIMGPSGSGKTSLLDVLAARARNPPEAGSVIEVNGVPTHASMNKLSKMSGYVLQEDVLHQYLTVFETLMVTARLVLPSTFTLQQRYDRVMRVVAQLGLGHAVDTKVGGPDVRGLSGGERRRVSVGIQSIKSPSLLFLDEPTSGLDSSTATKLVESLRDLANEGRTVVATIHQPSVQIFNFFDRLVLLSAGKTVWSGSRSAAEYFFSALNRGVPPKWNPADWFLFTVDVVREAGNGEEAINVAANAEKEAVGKAEARVLSYRLEIPSAPGNSKRRPIVKESVLRKSVAPESEGLDVSVLTEVIRAFYLTNNPDKLKNKPEIVDDVVKFALRKGVSELDKRLAQTYGGLGISSALAKALTTKNQAPLSLVELNDFAKAFESSPSAKEIVIRMNRAREEANAKGEVITEATLKASGGANKDITSKITNLVSLGQQIRILTERGTTLALRDPQVLRFQAVQNLVFGIVLGSLYSNLRTTQNQAYTLSMAIAIILGIVAMITIALGTAVAFSDKQVFVREQNDYMYSPVAHFFARLVVGLPISLVIAACLILPAYWWIGLKGGPTAFFFFFGVNLAMIFLFDGVVGVTTFLASDVTTAFGIGNFYEAIAIFMSGIFIPYPLIPNYWVWLYYITPFSYAYSAAAVNEFENTPNEFWIYTIGIVWLNKWGNLLVIILMGALWRVLGLFLAIRVNQRAQRIMKPKDIQDSVTSKSFRLGRCLSKFPFRP